MSESARSLGTDAAHRWRSPLLGEAKTLELAQGTIEYFERGRGPTLVLVHGWLANANLWREVVDALHEDFRCLTLDLPLGSHRLAMPQGADLGPDGIAALIASVLRDVAVVMSSASTAAVRSAGQRLIQGPPLPVLLVWSREDSVFPLAQAERYAQALPASALVVIDDAYSFTPEDQPTLVAEAIRHFAASA